MTDYQHEEAETDRLDDAQRPMTDAERKRIIDKIHRDIEEMKREDDAERVQPAQPGAAA